MKIKHTLAAALLAAGTLAASHAYAQGINITDGDLLLCFHASDVSNDLVIDLGSYLSPVSSINVNADLIAAGFGSSWYSDSHLQWAVIGKDQNGLGNAGVPAPGGDTAQPDTLFLSSNGVALNALTSSSQDPVANQIDDLYNLTWSGGNGAGTTTSDGVGDYLAFGSFTESWSQNPLTSIDAHFGSFAPSPGNVGASGHGTVTMYELTPTNEGSSSTLGNFTLNGNGNFTTTAVPEPSTWASIALGALALVGFRRRRA
jgi:hypothetical protein